MLGLAISRTFRHFVTLLPASSLKNIRAEELVKSVVAPVKSVVVLVKSVKTLVISVA